MAQMRGTDLPRMHTDIHGFITREFVLHFYIFVQGHVTGSGAFRLMNASAKARRASGKGSRALAMIGARRSRVRSQKSRTGAATSLMLLGMNGM